MQFKKSYLKQDKIFYFNNIWHFKLVSINDQIKLSIYMYIHTYKLY